MRSSVIQEKQSGATAPPCQGPIEVVQASGKDASWTLPWGDASETLAKTQSTLEGLRMYSHQESPLVHLFGLDSNQTLIFPFGVVCIPIVLFCKQAILYKQSHAGDNHCSN